MIIPDSAQYQQMQTLGGFLSNISTRDVLGYKILARTGSWVLPAVFDQLNSLEDPPFPPIDIILQNPLSMDLDTLRSVQECWDQEIRPLIRKGSRINIRYHEIHTIQEGVIVQMKNGQKAFGLTQAPPPNIRKQEPKLLNCFFHNGSVTIGGSNFQDHFDYLWGKKELHTIAFDFDDTLIESISFRIEAWLRTLMDLSQKPWFKMEYLDESLREHIKDEHLTRIKVKEVILKELVDPRVLRALFPNVQQEQLRQSIYNYRYSIREQLTLDHAELFDGVQECLQSLNKHYQLVIVSNTSEKLIKSLLKKFEIEPYFKWVLGRLGPHPHWQNLQNKTYHFLKLSRITGIPLERMVYVGDNHADFSSARQLQIPFVEARIIASDHGRESLVQYPKGVAVHAFTKFSQLAGMIKKLEVPATRLTDTYLAQQA